MNFANEFSGIELYSDLHVLLIEEGKLDWAFDNNDRFPCWHSAFKLEDFAIATFFSNLALTIS